MTTERRRDRRGRFVETWCLDESTSNRGPQVPVFLPKLPPPWKPRWYRKRGRIYVDANRGRLNGKPVRLCRKPEAIVKAVEELEREILQHGQLAKSLTSAQRWMAAEAFLVCERLGVQLIDVIREFEKTHPHGANARTLDQVRVELCAWKQLMAATLFRDRHPLLPACRAYLAIGMFAGLRPEEIDRLEWKHVSLETATIRVKAANAKDRDRRIVEVRPNLAAWLHPLLRVRGRVLEHPLDKLRASARTVLGLSSWPHDIMRHTFVSYHFGEFQNEAYTKKQVGHRDDGRVFYNHYMVPVSRADSRLFWATVPPAGLLTC